jgi:hypothetical protein
MELNVAKCLSGFWFSICIVTCKELLVFLMCVVTRLQYLLLFVQKDDMLVAE